MYGWTLSTILSILVRGSIYSIHSSAESQQSLYVEGFVVISCSTKATNFSIEWLETENENNSQAENFTISSPVHSVISSTGHCCNQLAYNATLDIAGSPVIRKMSNTTKEIVTCEGANVEFYCNVTSSFSPRISWRKNKDLFPGDSLMLSNVQRNNYGTYWCEISDNESAVIVRKDITLIVEFPPDCLITVPTIEIVEANNTEVEEECVLQCIVEGFPLPTITWYKEDAELAEHFPPQFNVTLYEVDYFTILSELRVLIVHNGTFMDNQLGNYTCQAANRHGTSSAVWHLLAACQGAPEIVSDGYENQDGGGNVTGFVIGMMPPLIISVYLIIQLGYRSRFADERGEQDGRRPDFITR